LDEKQQQQPPTVLDEKQQQQPPTVLDEEQQQQLQPNLNNQSEAFDAQPSQSENSPTKGIFPPFQGPSILP
jgi:hypothetical protein